MNASHDVEHRSREIRDLLASNDMFSAIKKLMDFARDFSSRDHLDETTLISMQYRQVEDALRREELRFAAANASRQKLALQMLRLIRVVEDGLKRELANV